MTLGFIISGVKNADENELRSIASDPEIVHMYNVADFSFLLDIVDNLTDNLCNSVKGPGDYPLVNHCVILGGDNNSNKKLTSKQAAPTLNLITVVNIM